MWRSVSNSNSFNARRIDFLNAFSIKEFGLEFDGRLVMHFISKIITILEMTWFALIIEKRKIKYISKSW